MLNAYESIAPENVSQFGTHFIGENIPVFPLNRRSCCLLFGCE